MGIEVIYGWDGSVLGFIDTLSNGDQQIRSAEGNKILGFYRKGENKTTDRFNRPITKGNTLVDRINAKINLFDNFKSGNLEEGLGYSTLNEMAIADSRIVDRLKYSGLRGDQYTEVLNAFSVPENFGDAVEMALKNNIKFIVIGDSGWGKSETIKSVAQDRLGWPILDFRLGGIAAEDLVGIPQKMELDAELADAINGDEKYFSNKIMSVIDYAPLKWIPAVLAHYKETGKPTVLLLDEITHAKPDVLNAAFQLTDKVPMAGQIKLGDAVRVCAAANFKDENPEVNNLSKPLLNRFTLKWVTPKDWKEAKGYLSSKYPGHKDFIQDTDFSSIGNPRGVERLIEHLIKIQEEENSKNQGTLINMLLGTISGNLKNEVGNYIKRILNLGGENKASKLNEESTLLQKIIEKFRDLKSKSNGPLEGKSITLEDPDGFHQIMRVDFNPDSTFVKTLKDEFKLSEESIDVLKGLDN